MCLELFGIVWEHLGTVWECLEVFGIVLGLFEDHLELCGIVWECLGQFGTGSEW